jgi:RecA-family ATPase
VTITTTAEHRLVMDARAEPKWLIDGFVGRTPALLYADPKVGKTHFALNMCAALLEGAPTFLDTQKVSGPASCLYVALDRGGPDEITERLEGLTRTPAFVTGDLNPDEWVQTVQAKQIRFVVLDNVAQILNDVEDFNAPGSIRGLKELVEKLEDVGASVLTVHHTSKPSRDTPQSGRTPSGTYALMAYMRQLIEMTPTKVIVKPNCQPRQEYGIRSEAAGEHGVRYVRDYEAKGLGGRGSTRAAKAKKPGVFETRSLAVVETGATTKQAAVQAIMLHEPKAERATIVHYVGQHAHKWGLT